MELNLTGNLRPISVRDSDHLRDDDIVVMEAESGFVRSLYRPYERHHFLFVTERCSSNCLMCSQPPKDKDDVDSLAERRTPLCSPAAGGPPFDTGQAIGQDTILS